MKKLVKILGALVVLVVVLLLALPLWFGPVVKYAVNAIVPNMTQTEFELRELSFNPYSGKFHLAGCRLGNPEGFEVPDAVKIGRVDISFALSELLENRLHILDADIAGVYVSYLTKNGMSNFEWIQQNVEKNRKKKEKKEKSDMKTLIDRLHVEGVEVQLGSLPVALPVTPITLVDIGKETNGLKWDELVMAIWAQAQKSFSGSRGALGALVGDTSNVLDGFTKGGKKLLTGNADERRQVLKDGAQATVDGAKKVGGAVGDGAKKVGGAVGDGMKKVGGAIGDFFK